MAGPSWDRAWGSSNLVGVVIIRDFLMPDLRESRGRGEHGGGQVCWRREARCRRPGRGCAVGSRPVFPSARWSRRARSRRRIPPPDPPRCRSGAGLHCGSDTRSQGYSWRICEPDADSDRQPGLPMPSVFRDLPLKRKATLLGISAAGRVVAVEGGGFLQIDFHEIQIPIAHPDHPRRSRR